ncbi:MULTISPECIES: transglycosylase family protein [Streptomyces]|uniref:Secreted protein n=1 Tax=Streptomyces sviceus (strain ATCC 29083 / DSM 924 / JCM 4929 / NBRC 13980 / NCIMB 11184 / NRRL 5439 / UC 5370) TaxID=463191 RepID=B5HX13_STRX2|nr:MULTISPECIES: transglycosylase family protein [Streptomyces]EDY57368.1 secreted protein [Streptomyces sviceus ATCC 29083]MYT06338.1 LysM peptidoglycan-binding domain-containing protein [Streptomyces sp. SID5470]
MLSGNGRHRRPRQAPALLVAAGVTGSAIAIPLLGATGASAATGTTWDRVAECESGGSWSANDGNGYYGGLQMSQENWEKYGGLEYAETADLASRNQQIAVAEKLLADQGIAAWPTCGLLNGLSKNSGSADVDTGVGSGAPSASTSGSSDSSGSSGSSNSAGSEESSGLLDALDGSSATPSPSASASSGDSSAKPDKKNSSGSGGSAAKETQPSDGSPVVSAEEDEADKSWQEGSSSALVDVGALGSGKHRGDSAQESATKSTASASAGRHAAATYVVQEGDSLVSIADSLGLDGGWRALYAENKDRIGVDPSNIVAGQTLDTGAE